MTFEEERHRASLTRRKRYGVSESRLVSFRRSVPPSSKDSSYNMPPGMMFFNITG